MTEWNGNDGAPWVALVDTTFDALISPVATLSDIGDSGLGVFLKLDGTSVMGGILDMGGNSITASGGIDMGANPISGVASIVGHSAADLLLQAGVGRNTKFNNNIGAEILNLLPTEAFFSIPISLQGNFINMGTGQITEISRIVADAGSNLDLDTRDGGSLTLGNASGTNWLYLDDDEGILTQPMEFRLGLNISGYDPNPPLYGGGDTFWYQGRNIRFKDTPGPPSDSEGSDGDVCLMYTF